LRKLAGWPGLGIGLELACNGGSFTGIELKRDGSFSPFAFEKTHSISLSCKLVPVQYRENRNVVHFR